MPSARTNASKAGEYVESEAVILFVVGVVCVHIAEAFFLLPHLWNTHKEARKAVIGHLVTSALSFYLLFVIGNGANWLIVSKFQWQPSILLACYGLVWAGSIGYLIHIVYLLLPKKGNE